MLSAILNVFILKYSTSWGHFNRDRNKQLNFVWFEWGISPQSYANEKKIRHTKF